MMKKSNFLIYGSYGFSGNLIAELALKSGLQPVLAGRDKEKLLAQANRLNLPCRHFDVANFADTKNSIQEFITVINCAGPFSLTYKNMAQACIETSTHYMDITGEYNVIEKLMALHQQALSANIMLLPGAGFDVVPSDCLAQYLKHQLPDATQLILAIHAVSHATDSGSGISRGTARTMANGIASGAMVREQGELKSIPLGWKKRDFTFGNTKPITCTTIAWGDLASAWWSTRIPNIETYMATPPKLVSMYKFINPIKKIFNWAPLKRYIQKRIDAMPAGPGTNTLNQSRALIYGEVINAAGKKVAALVETPNGYTLTALSCIHIVKKTLAANAPIGFQTPSTAYSQDLVLEIPGVTRLDIKK